MQFRAWPSGFGVKSALWGFVSAARGRVARIASAVLIATTAALTPARATNGELLHVSTALEGVAELVDITEDASDGTFWVLGADGSTEANHRIYHLNADLDTLIESFPNPHPAGSIAESNLTTNRGITYVPLSGTLLILASVGPRLEQTNEIREIARDGTEIAAGAFALPPEEEGNLFGLAYDPTTRDLWTNDIQGDRLVHFNRAGEIVESLTLPGKTQPYSRILGEGVAVAATDDGSVLWVPYGDIFASGPKKILELDSVGVLSDERLIAPRTGDEVPLSQLPILAVRGLEVYTDPLDRQRFAITGPGGVIFDVLEDISDPSPPTELDCMLTLRNEVELRWRNHGGGESGAYNGSIQVTRNGVPLTTIQGTASTFLDPTPVEGAATYALRGSEASGGPLSDESCECRVTVGSGGLIDWAPFPGNGLVDLAEDPRSGQIWATDSISDLIYRFDADLELIDSFPSPIARPAGIAFVPSITLGFPPQVFTNMLAIAEASGTRVRILSAAAPEAPAVTTLNMRLDSVATPQIRGLTFSSELQQFFLVENTTRQIFGLSSSGSRDSTCSPVFVASTLEWGITYDPIQRAFLCGFEDGLVREIFAQGNCAASGFSFSLSGLGPSFAEPGFTGGLQISGNSLLVAGVRAGRTAIYRVLIFPFSPEFVRGDVDTSGALNLTDALNIANYLFRSGPAPNCLDAADANDDGQLDIGDPVFLLFSLFVPDSPPPPAPYPDPGTDPTFRDNLGCAE